MYENDKISAYKDIKKAGAPIQFVRRSSGIYDPILDMEVSATARLDGDINDSQTSLFYNSLLGDISTEGEIVIDNERIYFDGKTINSLLNLERGYNATNSSIHLDNKMIYFSAFDEFYSTYAVLTNALNSFKQDMVDLGDTSFLVPAYNLDIIPVNGDKIKVGSDDWFVNYVDTVAPSNEPILYKLKCKK